MAIPNLIVTFKNIDKVFSKLKFLLIEAKEDPVFINKIAELTVERIRSFARAGKSLVEERPKRFKKLSNSYKDMRRGAVKFRTLKDGRVVAFPEPDEKLKEVDPQFFDPEFSNLTFTGQMLKALKYIITSTRSIVITVDDNKRTGKYEKLTNAEVAKYVAENGRPFLGLDDNGIKRIKKETIKQLRALLKRNNFR